MRPFERRQAGIITYFKLAVWDERRFTWKVIEKTYPSEDAARAAAVRPGRYRLCKTSPEGRSESEPFTVAA